MTDALARTGVIRPDPKDSSPLRIDEALVRKMLVLFIRDETAKARLRRAVVGVSGGVDSAVSVALASEALGAANVLGLFTPYRVSSEESRRHARLVAERFGFQNKKEIISYADVLSGNQVDIEAEDLFPSRLLEAFVNEKGEEVVLAGNAENPVHVARQAVEMRRHDGARV